jgi:hypothetical protein
VFSAEYAISTQNPLLILPSHRVQPAPIRIPLLRFLTNDSWRISSSPICPECRIPPSSEEGSGYKWEFALLLEDAQGDTLPVIVADEDADELLHLEPDKYELLNL